MRFLNEVDVGTDAVGAAFRMPVQWVNRPNADLRGFCGRVAYGQVRPSDRVRVLPSGVQTQAKAIVVWQAELEHTTVGDSITLTLTDKVDLGRGDVLVSW